MKEQEMTPADAKTPRIPWAGGECPVHPEALVRIEYPDGKVATAQPAKRLRWDHQFNGKGGGDIVAFWVVSSSDPDDIARYQPQEDSMTDDRITFPPDVSGEPCDGVLLVLDDGSEIAVRNVEPATVQATFTQVAQAWNAAKGGMLSLPWNGLITSVRSITRVHAVVDGKVMGRG